MRWLILDKLEKLQIKIMKIKKARYAPFLSKEISPQSQLPEFDAPHHS